MLDRLKIRCLVSKSCKIPKKIFRSIFCSADKSIVFFSKIIEKNHSNSGHNIAKPYTIHLGGVMPFDGLRAATSEVVLRRSQTRLGRLTSRLRHTSEVVAGVKLLFKEYSPQEILSASI